MANFRKLDIKTSSKIVLLSERSLFFYVVIMTIDRCMHMREKNIVQKQIFFKLIFSDFGGTPKMATGVKH